MSGRISFIGAGPGAADLITVRGARRVAEADVVVWAASLVAPECVQQHARFDVELVDSSRLTHEEAVEIYRRAERDKLKVARVHSGDPALWGAVQEQYDACARMQLDVEIVPGVAAFSAAAATAGHELTAPEVAQSLVLTRLEGGKTPMPDGEKVREFAKHGTTMALFLSAARTGQLVDELRAGGYADDVPVLVAYKVSWPDELILRTTLGELETTVKQHKLWRHTLFIIGRALEQSGARSRLYNPGHFHTYRRADPTARKALRSEQGGSGRSGAARRARRSARSRFDAADSDVDSTGSDAVPEPRSGFRGSGQSDSDVAWWAVRDWQETARGGSRFVTRTARRGSPGMSQQDLFVGAETESDSDGVTVEVGVPQDTSDVVNFSMVADEASVATESGPAASGGISDGVETEVAADSSAAAAESTVVTETSSSDAPKSDEPATAETGSHSQAKPQGKASSAKPQGKAAGAKSPGTKTSAKTAAKTAGAKSGTKAGQSKRGQSKTTQAKGGTRGKAAGTRGDAGEAEPGSGPSISDDRSG